MSESIIFHKISPVVRWFHYITESLNFLLQNDPNNHKIPPEILCLGPQIVFKSLATMSTM